MWDSSSEVRYFVLPERPEGTAELSEEELAALVTRDAMVGVGRVHVPMSRPRRSSWRSTGPTAPPRSNGELVFEAPWESRLFGVTVALAEAGQFEWSEFQQRLIGAVGRWEAEHPDGEGYRYYERWAEALESLLGDRGIVAPDSVGERAAELAGRPAGHDHDHAMTTSTAVAASGGRSASATAEARWEAGYRAEVTVRQFRFVVDEPPGFGGEDAGAMPTEYLLDRDGLVLRAWPSPTSPASASLELGPLTRQGRRNLRRTVVRCHRPRGHLRRAPATRDRRASSSGRRGSATSRTRWPGPPGQGLGNPGVGAPHGCRVFAAPLSRSTHSDAGKHSDQTVQVLIWKAPARQAVSAESSTSSGWNALTPGIRSSSRKPYSAPMANRQA